MAVQQVAQAIQRWAEEGRPAVAGRVVDIQGFSTWPGDELVAVDAAGEQVGQVFGAVGARAVQAAAGDVLAGASPRLGTALVEIQGAAVAEAGLSCGGRAEVLLQPVGAIPPELWELLAARTPAALLTRIAGPGAGPAGIVVDAAGRTWGGWPGEEPEAATATAVDLLRAGHSATRRVEVGDDVVLVEAWVPEPRLVVVGAGDLAEAIAAQAALLGWETECTDAAGEVGQLLDWAGGSAAVIVLSHDPHLDTPALVDALGRGAAYVGALGSRATQSRRLERLAATGVAQADLDRIHRPIGLDLGGRSAAEVALAICAEILAAHCGRDARPLRERTGRINDRPTATVS